MPTLFLGVFIMVLANPSCIPNSKSLASAVAEIITGTPKFLKARLAQCQAYFSLGCIFIMGFAKLNLLTKFEVIIFSRCRNNEKKP